MKPFEDKAHDDTPPLLPSLPAHQGPGKIRELFKKHPKWLRGVVMSKFRERITQSLNAIIHRNNYRPEHNSFSEDNPICDFNALFADLSLGMDFVERKKGEEGLVEYLEKLQIDTLLAIGKKVRTELFDQRIGEVRKKNLIAVDREKPVPMSGLAMSILGDQWKEDRPTSFQRVVEIEAWTTIFEQCEGLQQLASQLGLEKGECLASYDDDRSSTQYMLKAAGTGFLEIAVFVETFSHRFGTQPAGKFSLDYSDIAHFKQGVTFVERQEEGRDGPFILRRWEWNEGEKEAYLKACRERFPENPAALSALKSYLNDWGSLTNINYQTSSMNKSWSSNDILTLSFPTGTIPSQIILETGLGIEVEINEETENLGKDQLPYLKADLDFFLKLSDTEAAAFIGSFPYIGCWQRQLKNTKDPAKTAEWLNKTARVGKNSGIMLATKLWIALLSLDESIMHRDPTFEEFVDELQTGSKRIDLGAPGSFVSKVLKHLEEPIRNLFEQQCTQQITAQHLMEEVEDFECPEEISPFLALRYWHPAFDMTDGNPISAENIMELLKVHDPEQREHIIDYALASHIGNPKTFWNDIFDEFCVRHPCKVTLAMLEKKLPETILMEAIEEALILFEIAHFDRDLKSKNLTRIDLPYEQLCDPGSEEFRIPRCGKSDSGVLEKLSKETKRKLRQYFLTKTGSNLSDLCPESYPDQASFMFTKALRLEAEFLPIIEEIYGYEGHGLNGILAAKAAKSTPEIRNKLLTETLPVEDGAAVAIALLGDHARKKNDETSVAELKADTWPTKSKGFLPRAYGFLNAALLASPKLRSELGERLESVGDSKIADLTI